MLLHDLEFSMPILNEFSSKHATKWRNACKNGILDCNHYTYGKHQGDKLKPGGQLHVVSDSKPFMQGDVKAHAET